VSLLSGLKDGRKTIDPLDEMGLAHRSIMAEKLGDLVFESRIIGDRMLMVLGYSMHFLGRMVVLGRLTFIVLLAQPVLARVLVDNVRKVKKRSLGMVVWMGHAPEPVICSCCEWTLDGDKAHTDRLEHVARRGVGLACLSRV